MVSTPSPVTAVPAIPVQPSASSSVPLGPAGPAQSEWLIHFCSRPPGLAQSWSLDPAIAALIPEQRLHAILGQRRLRGFPPFGAQHPMVCLTESPLPHLQWLITHRRFPPWGVVLNRQWVYDMGGGPTWYVRAEQYARPRRRAAAVGHPAGDDHRGAVGLATRAGMAHPAARRRRRVGSSAAAECGGGNPGWPPSCRKRAAARPGRCADDAAGRYALGGLGGVPALVA